MFEPIDGFFLPSDAKVMNCAQCNVLLLCKLQTLAVKRQLAETPQMLPGEQVMIGNRPYCTACVHDVRRPDGTHVGAEGRDHGHASRNIDWDESGSSFDNAVRASEEDR